MVLSKSTLSLVRADTTLECLMIKMYTQQIK